MSEFQRLLRCAMTQVAPAAGNYYDTFKVSSRSRVSSERFLIVERMQHLNALEVEAF